MSEEKIFIKMKYKDLGGNWDDVKNIINKYPLLIETIKEVEKDKFKHWINHVNFSKGMTKKGSEILDYFREQLNHDRKIKNDN